MCAAVCVHVCRRKKLQTLWVMVLESLCFPPLTSSHQDKVLVSQGPHNAGIQVTNDGATILKSIGVDNPAAKVLVGMYYLIPSL